MRTAREIARDARRLWRLCLVDGAVDERRVRDVVDGAIESGHAGALPVLSELLRLVKLDRARRTARVESAAPLDGDVRADVEHRLARKYGLAITTTFVVDPTLIGGMRIRVGSDVWDGTVKGGLEALEARF